MVFDKKYLIDILRINFGYEILPDKIFGEVLSLDVRTAYRFCLTTNSYYLVDKYGLRLFGRFRTFNHRNYSLNQGLFLIETKNGEITSNNLPASLHSKYPFIYQGVKKIIFIDGKDTSKIILETYEKIIRGGGDPTEYILNIVHSDGSQWEHYFEFMASEIFIKKGYFTDIQLPWSYHGKPDLGMYKHKLIKILGDMNLIENGDLVLELSALRVFNDKTSMKKKSLKEESDSYEFIVGEVKTNQIKSQILEYLKTGLCFKAYEFIPKKKNREPYCGLIHINDKNEIVIKPSPVNPHFSNTKMEEDLEWFENYLKIHLLGNLSLKELSVLSKEYINDEKLTFCNLIRLVKTLTFKQITKVIANGI